MHYSIPEEFTFNVPFLCGRFANCVDSEFDAFPAKYGIDFDAIVTRGNSCSSDKVRDLAAFLQAWLIFGLLQRILNPSDLHVDVNDFVIDDIDTEDECDDQFIAQNGEQKHGSQSSNASTRFVCTYPITSYTIFWIARECHITGTDRKERLRRQHGATFTLVASVINMLVRWRRQFFPACIDNPEEIDDVMLSIILMVEPLADAYSSLFVDGPPFTISWELDARLRWYLVDSGWCPGEITQLHKRFVHATSLYKVSTFDRSCLIKNHSNCTEHICTADQIDESTYETRHAFEGCDCSHLGTDRGTPDQIADFLNAEIIPVIQITTSRDTNRATLSVSVQSSIDEPYVAISHVWSDGLGNAKGNSLPRCQLNRLQNYINRLYPSLPVGVSVPFWIDTICVPRHGDLRRKAIWLMSETYRSADKVLVVDDWFVKTNLTGDSTTDMLKVKACNWSQRLWTLPESILCPVHNLYFQTDRGAISEKEILKMTDLRPDLLRIADLGRDESEVLQRINVDTFDTIKQALIRSSNIDNPNNEIRQAQSSDFAPMVNADLPRTANPLMMELFGMRRTSNYVWLEGRNSFTAMRVFQGKPGTPVLEANGMLQVGFAMRFRSTSWLEDESICLATLLGHDPRSLLLESTLQGRMKVLYSQCQHVPVVLLFSTLSRIDNDGFRWAPLSFRQHDFGNARDPGVTFLKGGRVTPEGLIVTLAAFTIQESALEDVPLILCIDVAAQQYVVRLNRRIQDSVAQLKRPLALVLR